ncbi:MAG: hypothetical protein AAFP02_14330, partial [Bacteroidota bacterium]
QGKGTEGTYVLTASYTDKGASGAESLTARQVLKLRNPLVQIEDFDQSNKAQSFDVTPDMAPGIEEAFTIVIGSKGKHLMFEQLDLTGVSKINLLALAFKPIMDGGILEFRLDGLDGELVASVEVEAELSMSLEAEVRSVPLSGIQGQHDLYLIFKP